MEILIGIILFLIFIIWITVASNEDDKKETDKSNMQTNFEKQSEESLQKKIDIEEVLREQGARDTLVCGIIANNISMVKRAIDDGVDVNFEMQGEVGLPLNIAIAKRELEIVKELIKAGVDVNKMDKHMRTPLSYAIDERNDMRIIQELIKAGADVNGTIFGFHSLLWFAQSEHNYKVIEELKKSGATFNQFDNY